MKTILSVLCALGVRHFRSLITVSLLNCAWLTATEAARPLLNPVFADHMVLQRGKANTFWGWSTPGKEVTVELEGQRAKGIAAADGRWQVTIEVPPAGGPYSAKVIGDETVELHDLLVGDVWLCSGQSNMFFPLAGSVGGADVAKTATNPYLRLCAVPNRNAYKPEEVAQCEWATCSPESAARFSAVAFYFGRRVQKDVQIPIGLIHASVGGSPAESWMSAESLASLGEFTPQLAEIRRLAEKPGPRYGSFLMHWLDEYDAGGRGDAPWARFDLDERDWKTVPIPGGFAELGVPETPAVCWFRREILLPENAPLDGGKLFLGEVEKMDTAYVNGRWVGASSWVENPRVYPIPAGTLRPGKNLVAVRVFKTKPDGGFRSAPETLHIELADGAKIALAGEWKGKLSVDARPPLPQPLDWENYATMPTVLSNGTIAPLTPLAITGALWYQGEANQFRAAQYRKLLPALVRDWRARFGQGEIPVYVVSLPAFTERRGQPGGDGWTQVREAQIALAHTVPHTGVAITVDTGDAKDIHPKEKRIVGERLALCALAGHYGRPVLASGPTLESFAVEGNKLRLRFENVADGLKVRGKKLGEFSLAGTDRHWHWANAKIEGDTVVLSCPEVPTPVAARYAWQANPLATLYNTADLPAAPFRTDDWE
jgi:sialate O-acetylesterase